jgi:D-alanyl-D-alanine carboxypeptidase
LFTKNFQFVFKHFKKLIFSSIVIFIFCCPTVRADFDSVLAVRLQHTIDSVRSHHNYRGVSVSVFIPAKGSWKGTSGVSHGTVGITPDMKFSIASKTKTFIAVLMLKLQEMNILNLDDSLYKWIPNFQYVNPTITIRQLLNHTSGVFNFFNYPGYWPAMSDTGRYWTPEEILTTFLDPPYFDPGVAYLYSNTNYILAGMVIKAATGNSVSYNLRQLIFNPLNLTDTYFSIEESVSDTIAHGLINGIEINYPITSYWSSGWAAGAMYSTAENMVRFYKELFDVQIINQSSLNQMLTFPLQSIGIFNGLGIELGLIGGRVQYFHTGGGAGYISFTGIDTTARFIISVLINQAPSSLNNFISPLNMAISEHLSVGISNSEISLPAEYSLSQNYPNPFNPRTKISWQSPVGSWQVLKIFDILGNEIATLVDEYKPAGIYEVEFNASSLSSGVYFYQLRIGDPSRGAEQSFVQTRKMLLIR